MLSKNREKSLLFRGIVLILSMSAIDKVEALRKKERRRSER
jgi:hypothetical protein